MRIRLNFIKYFDIFGRFELVDYFGNDRTKRIKYCFCYISLLQSFTHNRDINLIDKTAILRRNVNLQNNKNCLPQHVFHLAKQTRIRLLCFKTPFNGGLLGAHRRLY